MKWLGCELHETGAGSFAAAVDDRRDDAEHIRINDEEVVNTVMSGMRYLARHARDRAAAGGSATVRATLFPVTEALPAELVHDRQYGMTGPLGRQHLTTAPVATGVYNVDDLAEDGPALLSATYFLATGLFQAFGQPEALQVTAAGALRTQYWGHRYAARVKQWAEAANVEISDEKV